jgi:hypothetical protein
MAALSPSPPRSSPTPATPRRRPPLPPLRIHTSSQRVRICRAATATPGADDYHSTIRSLNSRGRHVPRKSLAQVCPVHAVVPSPSSRISSRADVSVVSLNYMLDSKVNEELVAAAGVEVGDVVLEIGPATAGRCPLRCLRQGPRSSPSRGLARRMRFLSLIGPIGTDLTSCQIVL